MFNWFRRNEKVKQTQPESTSNETQPEVTEEALEETETQVAEPDYLAYAKAAYQNIQQRKGEAGTPKIETEEAETEIEEAEEEVISEEIATAEIPIADNTVTEELEEDTEPTTESSESEVKEEEKTEELEIEAKNVPAWMQKSQGLEKLKATAIETPVEEVEEVELDEDFVWSSKVLAGSGRSASDISEEEINWLTKLRQGLGKTRIGLVNQLKSIVGKGLSMTMQSWRLKAFYSRLMWELKPPTILSKLCKPN